MTEEPQKYEALLAGHYSDSNHFVYELLQNAEDVRASKVVIEYYCDKLIFYHNGRCTWSFIYVDGDQEQR